MRTRSISKRSVLALLCVILTGVATAYAAEYEISGTVETIELGPIYLSIYDAAGFDDEEPILSLVIDAEDAADGTAEFSFTGLDAGVYAIRVFQDLNGNEFVDIGRFGPAEPTGFYATPPILQRPPHFDEVAFELNGDIGDIVIELR